MNEVEFSVKYRQRSWNHICWTFDGEIGQASFYFNDHEPQKAIVSVKYQLYGAPKQFLAFGQEPDKFKGGYDQYQLFKGKYPGLIGGVQFCRKIIFGNWPNVSRREMEMLLIGHSLHLICLVLR